MMKKENKPPELKRIELLCNTILFKLIPYDAVHYYLNKASGYYHITNYGIRKFSARGNCFTGF